MSRSEHMSKVESLDPKSPTIMSAPKADSESRVLPRVFSLSLVKI